MVNSKVILLFLFVFIFSLTLTSAELPICLDTNQQDISKVPCLGFTIPINCSGNVTAFNATDPTLNFSFNTTVFVGNVRNFTLNLSRGEYELIDCENNTATILIGLVEQGYGITIFTIIFPSILLSLLGLFVSGRLFNKFHDDDDEEREHLEQENDQDSFVPKSRLIPIVIMLFSFLPMITMTAFVNLHLEEYLPDLNATQFYGTFYIMFLGVFIFVTLISFVVWLSSFIKLRRVMRGLDDID